VVGSANYSSPEDFGGQDSKHFLVVSSAKNPFGQTPTQVFVLTIFP